MKRFLNIIGLIISSNLAFTQNLVPNSGFENDTMCNVCLGSVYYGYIPPWDSPTMGSPDGYNICAPTWTVPNCFWGYQQTHSGNGFIGLAVFGGGTNEYREYLQVQLDSPLVSGQRYCASFYVSLANLSDLACNNFGMYFSNTHTYISTIDSLGFTPQINDTSIISDSVGWHIVYGKYTAQGGERYIIIGNFHSNANTDTTYIQGSHLGDAYYYIDDVNVHCCACDSTTSLHAGVGEIKNEDDIEVYPNPATTSITVTLLKGEGVLTIFNVLGEKVFTTKIINTQTEIDVGNLPQGMYFVEVRTPPSLSSPPQSTSLEASCLHLFLFGYLLF